MPTYYKPSADDTPKQRKRNATHPLEERPAMPSKSEVADYFGYNNATWFFNKVLFKKILPNSEYTAEGIKNSKRLPPALAQEIYYALGWTTNKKSA